jgi:hypothetical protein
LRTHPVEISTSSYADALCRRHAGPGHGSGLESIDTSHLGVVSEVDILRILGRWAQKGRIALTSRSRSVPLEDDFYEGTHQVEIQDAWCRLTVELNGDIVLDTD